MATSPGTVASRSSSSSSSEQRLPRDLDALAALDDATLGALYRDAVVPRIDELRGDLRGRMLAIPAVERSVLGAPLRAVSGSSLFPWRGKSFSPHDALHGEGINRVVSDRLRLFRFTTEVGPSRAGDFDALQLDYDHAGNPFFIRAIRDELRQLRPGLWLGQAYLLVGGRTHLVLWFGLES